MNNTRKIRLNKPKQPDMSSKTS